MSQAIEYIKKAQNGQDMSRFELEKIYQDEESLEYLINCLEDSVFQPFMFKKFSENIKKGNLGALGSFYPVDETYKQNNQKATGEIPYDGMFNTDCGNIVGKNKNYEIQDIASVIIGFVLFMGAKKTTNDMLLKNFKEFILNPPDNYKITNSGNCCSPFRFPGTGIGGKGELLIYRDNSIVGKLQIDKFSDNLLDKLNNITVEEEIAKLLLGNLGMVWALGFPESFKLNNNENNLYYWGPSKLIEYGII